MRMVLIMQLQSSYKIVQPGYRVELLCSCHISSPQLPRGGLT